ncbi:MAG: histone H1 [Betaproteobacteria bacterium]|nr:histone H1 [Betaproteobacteria bacterium]
MQKRQKRPDLNQLAASIVAEATGEAEPTENPKDKEKKESSVKGGKKGGKARAEKLTPEERSEIARLAAEARWKKGS